MTNNLLLSERFVYDCLKPEVDAFEKAKIIMDYMKAMNLSQAGFCRKFGIPETTLHTWIRITKNEELYNAVLERGGSKTEAFRVARGDKLVASTDLEYFLEETKRKVREFKHSKINATPVTKQLIEETVNELNMLYVDINLKEKRKKK